MTTSPRSLRDWLRDQLREIRQLSPLSVLAPAKRTPVPDLVDMPSGDSVPMCENRSRQCDRIATVRVKGHFNSPTGRHGDCCALLCDPCLDVLRARAEQVYRDSIPIMLQGHTPTCLHSGCDRPIRCVHDIIQVVTPL